MMVGLIKAPYQLYSQIINKKLEIFFQDYR